MQGLLGTASSALVADIVRALLTRDVPSGLRAISQAFDGGAEPRQFVADLLEYLRALMLLTVAARPSWTPWGPRSWRNCAG